MSSDELIEFVHFVIWTNQKRGTSVSDGVTTIGTDSYSASRHPSGVCVYVCMCVCVCVCDVSTYNSKLIVGKGRQL